MLQIHDEYVNYDDPDNVTQHAMARRFAAQEAGVLRYCHDTRAWFVWTGQVWRRDRTGQVLQRLRDQAAGAACDPMSSMPPLLCGRPRFLAEVERFARADPALAVTAEVWDADPFKLGTPDGTVDLRTGQISGSVPAYGITKITSVRPDGIAEYPLWNRFLDETFVDQALIQYLRQFFGYALTGAVNEQILLFGHGTGGNGKSVLMNVVSRILGDYARPAVLSTLTGTAADLAALRGARLVTVAESGAEGFDEERIKLLTGGDPIVLRTSRGPRIFTPTFKLFLTGNAPPKLRTVDPAMKRRLRIIPFANVPERPDRDLEDRLMTEAPQILHWMIGGCLAWRKHGFDQAPAVREASTDYFETQDIVGQFLDDACDCAQDEPTRMATAGALYAAWTAWAREIGEPAGSQRAFGDALAGRGFLRHRTNSTRFFKGLSLKPKVNSDAR